MTPYRIHVAYELDLESLFIAYQDIYPLEGPIYKVLVNQRMLDDGSLSSTYLRDYAIDMVEKTIGKRAPAELSSAIVTAIAQYRMLRV